MGLRFAKIVDHARPPEKLNVNDPGLTLFSAEDFNVEHGELHSYRTGIMIEVPPGGFGMIVVNHGLGVQGGVVCGGVLTPNDVCEVRVSLANLHRNAIQIKAGAPLAQLILIANGNQDDSVDEYDREGLMNEMKATVDKSTVEA